MKHRVSVVIPTFNRATLVAEAVSSVLAQSVKPYEVIVVDDCSTDNTLEILEEFGSRIRVLQPAENGRGALRGISERANLPATSWRFWTQTIDGIPTSLLFKHPWLPLHRV